MRTLLTLAAGGALLLTLTACGGSGDGAEPAAAAAPASTSATSSPAPSPSKTASAQSAEQVVVTLAQEVDTAGAGVVYDATSDPNHLLGRPGGYVSKASFTDTDVDPKDVSDDSQGSVDLGGSVEVFADAAAATARGTYIQKVGPSVGSHEYDYTAGPVLLRLSAVLTPDQAEVYRAALAEVVDAEATAIA